MCCTNLRGYIYTCYLDNFVGTRKFNNGLHIHFARLQELKSSHNSSRVINRTCEWAKVQKSLMFGSIAGQRDGVTDTTGCGRHRQRRYVRFGGRHGA